MPDLNTIPAVEPPAIQQYGKYVSAMSDYVEMRRNPGSMEPLYYPISIEKKELMRYARDNDGSPNAVLSALLFRMAMKIFPDSEQISGKIVCNYRKDVGCPETHCDLVRFLRVVYPSKARDWSVERISTVTRGSMYLQMEPEFSGQQHRKLAALRQEIDEQPDLEAKKRYAIEHSLLTHAPSDTYTVSYVGKVDWGGLGTYIENVYTLSDGHVMLEVNATEERFCISFQTIRKDDKYLREFLQAMDEEGIHYHIGDRERRNLPSVVLDGNLPTGR